MDCHQFADHPDQAACVRYWSTPGKRPLPENLSRILREVANAGPGKDTFHWLDVQWNCDMLRKEENIGALLRRYARAARPIRSRHISQERAFHVACWYFVWQRVAYWEIEGISIAAVLDWCLWRIQNQDLEAHTRGILKQIAALEKFEVKHLPTPKAEVDLSAQERKEITRQYRLRTIHVFLIYNLYGPQARRWHRWTEAMRRKRRPEVKAMRAQNRKKRRPEVKAMRAQNRKKMNPEVKAMRAQIPRRCLHGLNMKRNFCVTCYGCEHGLRKSQCKVCCRCSHGKAPGSCPVCHRCAHGFARSRCRHCHSCPHGRLKRTCLLCNGCEHGRIRTPSRCGICFPCPHGQLVRDCRACNSCEHGRLRRSCTICFQCHHGVFKRFCKICRGCHHGNLRHVCEVCKAARARPARFPINLCEHQRLSWTCRECNPLCEHNNLPYQCMKCKVAAGFVCPFNHNSPRKGRFCGECHDCEHKRLRWMCRECNPTCEHNRLPRYCPKCKQAAGLDSNPSHSRRVRVRTPAKRPVKRKAADSDKAAAASEKAAVGNEVVAGKETGQTSEAAGKKWLWKACRDGCC